MSSSPSSSRSPSSSHAIPVPRPRPELDLPAEEETWSRTSWSTVRGRHVWLVDGFEELLSRADTATKLRSEVFRVRKFKFQVVVRPKGDSYGDYVAIEFHSFGAMDVVNYSATTIQVSFTIKSKDDKEEMFKPNRKPNAFSRSESRQTWAEKFSPDAETGTCFREFAGAFKRADLLQHAETLMPDGELALVCNVRITLPVTRDVPNPVLAAKTCLKSSSPKLKHDLKKLLVDADLADFTLVCGETRLPCHRAVLSARSPVFRAMLAHSGTREATSNEMNIEDVDADTMEKVLEFIYSDMINGMSTKWYVIADAFAAADKYEILELRSICERALVERLRDDNAAELLVLADAHGAALLKERAMTYAIDNMAAVAVTEGWRMVLDSHPKIMNEILQKEFAKASLGASPTKQ